MTEAWLTKGEVAQALKISPRSVERHIRPSLTVGAQHRYFMSEVIEQLRGKPAEVIPLREAS
jgi:hypothetical protein